MEFLKGLLADPVVSAVGYILTVVSGVIAIVQVSGKAKAKREIVKLRSEISNVTNEKTS